VTEKSWIILKKISPAVCPAHRAGLEMTLSKLPQPGIVRLDARRILNSIDAGRARPKETLLIGAKLKIKKKLSAGV
jgi:hypothetical protein